MQYNSLGITLTIITVFLKGYYSTPGIVCQDEKQSDVSRPWSDQLEDGKTREQCVKAILECMYVKKEELKYLVTKLLTLKQALDNISECSSAGPDLKELIPQEVLYMIDELEHKLKCYDKKHKIGLYNYININNKCKPNNYKSNQYLISNITDPKRINTSVTHVYFDRQENCREDSKKQMEKTEATLINNPDVTELDINKFLQGSKIIPLRSQQNNLSKPTFNCSDNGVERNKTNTTADCDLQYDTQPITLFRLIRILGESNPRCQSGKTGNSSYDGRRLLDGDSSSRSDQINILDELSNSESTKTTSTLNVCEKLSGNNSINCEKEEEIAALIGGNISFSKIRPIIDTERQKNKFSYDTNNTINVTLKLNDSSTEIDKGSYGTEKHSDALQVTNNHKPDTEEREEYFPLELIINSTGFKDIYDIDGKTTYAHGNLSNSLPLTEKGKFFDNFTGVHEKSLLQDDNGTITKTYSPSTWDDDDENEISTLKSNKISQYENNSGVHTTASNNKLQEHSNKTCSEPNDFYKCFICAEPVYNTSVEKPTNEPDDYNDYEIQYPCMSHQLPIEVQCNEIRDPIIITSEPSIVQQDYLNKLPTRDSHQYRNNKIFEKSKANNWMNGFAPDHRNPMIFLSLN